MLGQNSIKSNTIVIDSSIPDLHEPEYFVNSFPLYFSGQWRGTGQYISSIIDLDFDQIIQLREKLFIEYGYRFLQSLLFRKMNKQIYILNDCALTRILRAYHSNDLDYLNEKKLYISKLLKENNERLDQLKFKYVISLHGKNLDLFNDHFYIYSKMYEYVLGDINTRIFMFTYHYDTNTGTFPLIEINESADDTNTDELVKNATENIINECNLENVPSSNSIIEVTKKITSNALKSNFGPKIKTGFQPTKLISLFKIIFNYDELVNYLPNPALFNSKSLYINPDHINDLVYRLFDYDNTVYDRATDLSYTGFKISNGNLCVWATILRDLLEEDTMQHNTMLKSYLNIISSERNQGEIKFSKDGYKKHFSSHNERNNLEKINKRIPIKSILEKINLE